MDFIKKQSGFTLVELLVIIVVLSTLTAVVMPYFSKVKDKAYAATLATNAYQIKLISDMAHSLGQIEGIDPNGTVILDPNSNTAVQLKSGYPDATNAGIGAAVNMSGSGFQLIASPGGQADTLNFQLRDLCYVQYLLGANGAPPSVTYVASGC